MGARILHFGLDEANRVAVLRSAGYSVQTCPSLPNLDSALHHDDEPAAVIMSDSHASETHDVLNLVHSSSLAPLILFERTTYCPDERDFDLVIPNLTPVREWLEKIASIIERTRSLHADAKSIHMQSAVLVQESTVLRKKLVKELERSANVRSRAKGFLSVDEKDPDPAESD